MNDNGDAAYDNGANDDHGDFDDDDDCDISVKNTFLFAGALLGFGVL